MKKIFFYIFTILSIICFALVGMLFYIQQTQESPGMILIYFIPFLVMGLLFFAISFLLKKFQKLELSKYSTWLFRFNLVTAIVGLLTLLYTLNP